ncbi:cell surface protein [Clostridium botulinum C str. Eklund]|nr:cell surface protein [Clostridium botulinum C str. Eklund]NEZ48848.1 DUF11 domain-containing protein [Clostridium botulinum]
MSLHLAYQTNLTGGMTFTGNTLGLSKEDNSSNAGIANSIGAYTIADSNSHVTNYPEGTTSSINTNSSKAVLNIPEGSTIQSAYLIWGGSSIVKYGLAGSEDNQSLVKNPVNFEFPTSAPGVTPVTYETQQISPGGKQLYPSHPSSSEPYTFYTNWADVTRYVQHPGTFKVSNVVGTTAISENDLNCCGWLLAVLYKNSFLPARNFSLYVGVDYVNIGAPVDITTTNFTTPVYGLPKGRLLIGALNGDAPIDGDQVLFGANTSNLTPLSGPENLVNNFFGSQINNDTGNTDTTGTFGNRNQNIHTGTNMIAGRQGIDITNVDASSGLTNNQSSANVRFNTNNDTYFISALGTQIDINSPIFDTSVITTDKKYVTVGDTVNFTIKVTNTGNALAQYVTLKDILPPEFSFVPDSLVVDGGQTSTDVTTIVPLRELSYNQTTTLTFSATVNAPVTGGGYTYINRANLNYAFRTPYDDLVKNFAITPNVIYNKSIAVIPIFSKKSISNNSIQEVAGTGDTIDYTITIFNFQPLTEMINTVVKDTLPTGLTYKADSLIVNNTPSSNDLSSINVGIVPNETLIDIKFTAEVTGPPPSNSKYVNSADINYEFIAHHDGATLSNYMSTSNSIYSDSIVIIPTVKETAISSNPIPDVAGIGDTINYAITVTNPSPSDFIQNVILKNTLPEGLTYKPDTLFVNDRPSTDNLSSIDIGTINTNSTTTIKFTANVTGTPSSDSKYVDTTIVNYEFLTPDNTALSNRVSVNNAIYSDSIIITPTINISASPKIVNINDIVVYSITITNTTSTIIKNPILIDTLPSGLTYKANSLTVNDTESKDSLETGITLPNIDLNNPVTVKFKATVVDAPSVGIEYINNVTLDYDFTSIAGNLSNKIFANNTIHSTAIIIKPKLLLSSNKHSVILDDYIEFTLLVENTNSTTVENPMLAFKISNGLSFVPRSLNINGSNSSESIENDISLANISPNKTSTVIFQCKVKSLPPNGIKYSNLATIRYSFQSAQGQLTNVLDSNINSLFIKSFVVNPLVSHKIIYTTSKNNPLIENINSLNLSNTSITYSLNTYPVNGYASISENGTLIYTPKIGFIGEDTFSLLLSTKDLDSVVSTIIVIVQDSNNVKNSLCAFKH